jgi:DNA-binding NtrC family response regulator
VRELRNVVEATLALGSPPPPLSEPPGASSPPRGEEILSRDTFEAPYKDARDSVLREFERRYLTYWLDRAGGNVARASRMCRMDRSHLFQLLRRHGIR